MGFLGSAVIEWDVCNAFVSGLAERLNYVMQEFGTFQLIERLVCQQSSENDMFYPAAIL